MKKYQSSQECTKSELDLLHTPFTQTAVQGGSWMILENSGNYTGDTPLTFELDGSGNSYYDLADTKLFLVCEIADNNNPAATSPVGPVNLFLHSLFAQVDVTVNGTVVTGSSNMYPYQAYIETLLNHSQDAKESYLGMEMFYKDTSGYMDNTDTNNEGFIKRNKLAQFKKFEMMGRIHSDIFMQDRYFLNNTKMTIKLTRSKAQFCLMAHDTYTPSSSPIDLQYKVLIRNAQLHVRCINLNPDVLLGHAMALEKATAKYPINRVEMKNFTLGINTSSVTNIIHTGELPKRVVFGFVESEAYNGKYSKNPFNFKHFDISSIELKLGGKAFPHPAIKTDFNAELTLQAYNTLFIGSDRINEGNNISRSEYNNGYTLFAYDLSSDLCNGSHLDLAETGQLTLELTFDKSLPQAVMLIVYMEHQNMIQITKNRQVLKDF